MTVSTFVHIISIFHSIFLYNKYHYLISLGVNDAPALKRADVGIAVSGATDAARAAADMILTEEGLSTIIHGILIARCSRHLVAVIDSVIHDTHDSSRGGRRCVYGYYQRVPPPY